jgi:hypothetical protein
MSISIQVKVNDPMNLVSNLHNMLLADPWLRFFLCTRRLIDVRIWSGELLKLTKSSFQSLHQTVIQRMKITLEIRHGNFEFGLEAHAETLDGAENIRRAIGSEKANLLSRDTKRIESRDTLSSLNLSSLANNNSGIKDLHLWSKE